MSGQTQLLRGASVQCPLDLRHQFGRALQIQIEDDLQGIGLFGSLQTTDGGERRVIEDVERLGRRAEWAGLLRLLDERRRGDRARVRSPPATAAD